MGEKLNQDEWSDNPSWIRFMAPVTAQTTDSLFKAVDQIIQQGHDHIHLMISSPGGSVFHGLSAHNYLRGIGVPVTTYNFGSVDSIGVIVFCAGQKRICVPHARFLIHEVSLQLQGNPTLDEHSLDEHLKSVKIDSYNIARVIADTIGKEPGEVEESMLERTTLSPIQAIEYGLVTDIKKDLYKGGQIHAIYEQG